MRIRANTLSLNYNAREDRVKLIINKDEKNPIEFWITRRFYLSILFELETFFEQHNISYIKPTNKTLNYKMEESKKIFSSELKNISYLLESINVKFNQETENFIFIFQSKNIVAESILRIEQCLDFYLMFKNTFPKSEWGII